MLTRLRDQLGTAGFVVAIVALVAALAGGAYAASNGLNSTQKKEVKKIAKSFQGTGPAGAAGAAGPAGAAGAKGDTGDAGADGQDGVSATTTSFTGVKGSCGNGGVTVKSASPEVNVCNGKNGQTGFTETLPSEMTETGGWSIVGANSGFLSDSAISFSIPLEAAIAADKVHFEPTGGFTGEDADICSGSVADPTAEAGHLCVYVGYNEGTWEAPQIYALSKELQNGASKAGAILSVLAEDNARLFGSWAVTAP